MKPSALIARSTDRFRKLRWYIMGKAVGVFLRAHGCTVGRGLKCKQWPTFRSLASSSITIGDHVTLGYRITIETVPGAHIQLDNHVQLTQDIIISCREHVHLEEHVSLSEFVSIRDSDHGIARSEIPHAQESVSEAVILKRGSGVGRGSALFRGVILEEGALIGANTIVMRGMKTVPYGIYFGNPPRLIMKRR